MLVSPPANAIPTSESARFPVQEIGNGEFDLIGYFEANYSCWLGAALRNRACHLITLARNAVGELRVSFASHLVCFFTAPCILGHSLVV